MSKKEDKGSRFDGLFGAVKAAKQDEETLDIQTSKLSDIQTSKSLDVQAPEHLNAQASKRSSIQTSGHLEVQASEEKGSPLSKSKDPNYQRTTIYIPKPLHRKLKAIAAEDDREISDIVENLIQDWIGNRNV